MINEGKYEVAMVVVMVTGVVGVGVELVIDYQWFLLVERIRKID